jgi:hypothetical protein
MRSIAQRDKETDEKMRKHRLLAIPMTAVLSLGIAGTAFAAWTGNFYSFPCTFQGTRETSLLIIQNHETDPDYCTEVGAQLAWKVCPACQTINYNFDYDTTAAVVDIVNQYVYVGSWVRSKDDGLSSGWVTWQ